MLKTTSMRPLLKATSAIATCLLILGAISAAHSQQVNPGQTNLQQSAGERTTGQPSNQQKSEAQQLVDRSVKVIEQMKSDPKLFDLAKKSKGLFIVPEFGRGAFVVGGRGGAGLVTVRQDGRWSDPAFYDFGAVSLGPQVGASGGSVVFLLVDQNAVDAFKSGNKISLNAEAGISIVTYSASGQASWGKGDIIMWSNTVGAYAGATVSVTDINWADKNNKQYYGQKVDMTQILNGTVKNASASELKNALPI